MKLGSLKLLQRTLASSTVTQEPIVKRILDAWLRGLSSWTPSNRREIVQACMIFRHLLDRPPHAGSDALSDLRASVTDVVRRLRSRCPETARAIRALPQAAARAGLNPAQDAPETNALKAIVRAARPSLGSPRRYREPRASNRRAL